MKTNRKNLNDAFSEVESLDYMIISVIVSGTVKIYDKKWPVFPPITISKQLKEWDESVDMILVGLRSTGTIAVPFSCKDGKFQCLMTMEERVERHGAVFNPIAKSLGIATWGEQ